MTISVIGWCAILYHSINLSADTSSLLVLLLFALFLGITEYYPIPVWKGFTTINFPLLYTLYLIYGLSMTVTIFALVLLVTGLWQKRPLRILLFNPAQLGISFILAVAAVETYMNPAIQGENLIIAGTLSYCLLLLFYYVINNVIVDMVLLLRPQPYKFDAWKNKLISEANSALISIMYGVLFYILGSQNRGEIDVFSYFFFFSPLIAISLIGAGYMRIKTEKNRLKSLFIVTKELNKHMLQQNPFQSFFKEFKHVVFYDELLLLSLRHSEWNVKYDGRSSKDPIMENCSFEDLPGTQTIHYIKNRKYEEENGLTRCFSKEMKAFVCVPLLLEEELLGLLVVARSRSNSFLEEERNALATTANQLAAVLKTRTLVKEEEEKNILEERNRIARNIHDGIAQNLAGAVLNLETAQRKWAKHPDDSYALVDACTQKLRESLLEVRNSIYALKPPSRKNVGLIPAINKRIEEFYKDDTYKDTNLTFSIRGKPYTLSSMVEGILFDTFQESVQNSLKHSEARNIDVSLHYQKENIMLKIKDDGKGFSLFHAMIKAQKHPHFGIMQMNEAADKINATLHFESKEGSGTEVILGVPRLGMEGER
ncbi:sensor histidine kinase [Rossellomorea sp. AcN35-11]|nr:sensor histidine kinase [Rossellomorea aquimaris]WJV29528.1 sensor histidine kinase [Rossellomorea sp. AcN35-11]